MNSSAGAHDATVAQRFAAAPDTVPNTLRNVPPIDPPSPTMLWKYPYNIGAVVPAAIASAYHHIALRERCRYSSAPPAAGDNTNELSPLSGVYIASASGMSGTRPMSPADTANIAAAVTAVRCRL